MTVIKELLGLVEMKRGKDNKAVVASNIMYIVGQYPRFLKAHWKFLKTVVNKLFEFMHETHEGASIILSLRHQALSWGVGVQDMACDTFIKITQKTRRHFVMTQNGETEPFVDEILANLERITQDLSPHQVHTFYEAIGYMISAQPNKPAQEKLIAKLMALPNAAVCIYFSFPYYSLTQRRRGKWEAMMQQAQANADVLGSQDNVKLLANVLKTNVAACTSIGTFFVPQISRIFLDMLQLYQAVSGMISMAVANEGMIEHYGVWSILML